MAYGSRTQVLGLYLLGVFHLAAFVRERRVSISSPRIPVPRKLPSRPYQKPRLQDTVRLSADGLAKVLGDLEARVLRTVWHFGEPVPARAVFELVTVDHPVSPLTVITVLNKLVDKRILGRRKQDDLYHYSARMTEAEFVAHVSRRVVEGILSFSPDAVSASMVDVLAERDPAQLAELARLIQRRIREQGVADRGAADARPKRPTKTKD